MGGLQLSDSPAAFLVCLAMLGINSVVGYRRPNSILVLASGELFQVNPFQVSVPFLYPLKTGN